MQRDLFGPRGERVLVCGGREFTDRAFIFEQLDALHAQYPFHIVIHGCARGADTLAGEWAEERKIKVAKFPVSREEWKKYGWRAGHLRNERMIVEGKPTMGIAFPGAGGTADMTRRLVGRKILTVFTEEGWKEWERKQR